MSRPTQKTPNRSLDYKRILGTLTRAAVERELKEELLSNTDPVGSAERDRSWKKRMYAVWKNTCSVEGCRAVPCFVQATDGREMPTHEFHHEKYLSAYRGYEGCRPRAPSCHQPTACAAFAHDWSCANDPSFTVLLCKYHHNVIVHRGGTEGPSKPDDMKRNIPRTGRCVHP